MAHGPLWKEALSLMSTATPHPENVKITKKKPIKESTYRII
jgi:hypothetical protein